MLPQPAAGLDRGWYFTLAPLVLAEPFRLETDPTRVSLLQGGNADFPALGIDRLVHHPFLPR